MKSDIREMEGSFKDDVGSDRTEMTSSRLDRGCLHLMERLFRKVKIIIACWERKTIKEVMGDASGSYLKGGIIKFKAKEEMR